ncbi:putative pyridoxal-dependent aspartate 1-decarboxylase, partial [Vibrio parahaemolyticus V-223/04]
SENRCKQPYCC